MSICRVCTYILRIYVRLVYHVEIPIVLLYLLRCLVYHMLSKTRRNSRSLHRVIAYICCIYFVRCLVYHMLFKTRRNSGSLHRVIGEVLVLGMLLVVYKIPYYSSCILNTWYCTAMQARFWCVPIILLSIWYTTHVVACVIFTHGFSRCRGYWI